MCGRDHGELGLVGILPMRTQQKGSLRAGNSALECLLFLYSPMDPKLQALTDSLPKFGDELYRHALDEAGALLRSHTPNPLKRVAREIAAAVSGESTKQTLLANCIFDLHLTVFYLVFMEHLGDSGSALALVEALLYQANGSEPASPADDEKAVSDACTQDVRGINKFQVARKTMAHLGDVEAWIFGMEFSAIVSGEPKDIAKIVSVSTFCLATRVHARWRIRYLLYGVLPTEEDKEALAVGLRNQAKKFQDMIDGFGKS
jgi:hypothetical protein